MLRNAVWLVLIACAAAAIAGGYVQATVTTHPPPLASVRTHARSEAAPALPAAPDGPRGLADEAIADLFAGDDVVVDRPRSSESQWQPRRLAIVVGLCGESVAAESGFLRLGFPVAIDLDPGAPQAAALAAVARGAGAAIFVHTGGPPGAARLADLRRRLGAIDGVAGRDGTGMPAALRGTGLAYFDERGDRADALAFSAAGVPLVQRDVTADDRSPGGYVAFMLERAAALSRRVGPVVVLVRPLPSSLAALQSFAASHDVQMIALR